jgi:hypothetical protein
VNQSAYVYVSSTFEAGGHRIFLFTFLPPSPSPLPSGQYSPVPPGRYVNADALWDNYGSFHDPKVSATTTPLPCYNLSNDVINQSIQNNAATMSLAVFLQATATPLQVKPIVIYNKTPDPKFPGVDSLAYIPPTISKYPVEALLYLWYGPITSQAQEDQVIYHELDHFYYSGYTNGVFPAQRCQGSVPCAASTTLTLGGKKVTFLWNFIPVNGTASNGYGDFIHMLIHNDIVNGLGPDKTSALAQAFDQVSPPPSPAGVYPTPNAPQWSALVSSYGGAQIPWSWATPTPTAGFTPSPLPSPTPTHVPGPPTNLTCANAPHLAARALRAGSVLLVKLNSHGDPVK